VTGGWRAEVDMCPGGVVRSVTVTGTTPAGVTSSMLREVRLAELARDAARASLPDPSELLDSYTRDPVAALVGAADQVGVSAAPLVADALGLSLRQAHRRVAAYREGG
jgi:hypothetical protein